MGSEGTKALGSGACPVYDEPTFRYLRAVEQKRSKRSGSPFLVVLVDDGPSREKSREKMDPAAADDLFRRLSGCLRQTDFVGWYEDGRVAGAVLTELGKERPHGELPGLVGRRICDQLRSSSAGLLRVRVSARPEAGAPGGFEAVLRSDPGLLDRVRWSLRAMRRALAPTTTTAPSAAITSPPVPTGGNGHGLPGMPEAMSRVLKSHPGQSGATRC